MKTSLTFLSVLLLLLYIPMKLVCRRRDRVQDPYLYTWLVVPCLAFLELEFLSKGS